MLTIRPATPADVPLILEFIRELAEYERDPQAAVATQAGLLRDGFGPEPKFRVDIAEWGGEPAGFAFYFWNYSTWQGRPACISKTCSFARAFAAKELAKLCWCISPALRSRTTAAAWCGRC